MNRLPVVLLFFTFVNFRAQTNCFEKLFIGIDYKLSTKKIYNVLKNDSNFSIVSTYADFRKSDYPAVLKSRKQIYPYDTSDSLHIHLGSSTDGSNPDKTLKLKTVSVLAFFKTQSDRDAFRHFIKTQLCKDLKIGNQPVKDIHNNDMVTTEDIYLFSGNWYPSVLFCDIEESNKWVVEITYQDTK